MAMESPMALLFVAMEQERRVDEPDNYADEVARWRLPSDFCGQLFVGD